MKTFATTLCAALLLALVAVPASAQSMRGLCDVMEDVTINQLTSVPQDNINQLNALGPDASAAQIGALLTNEYHNPDQPAGSPFRCVRVEGVVISDPRYSGLASWNSDANMPGRIHFFIRDTAAETQGPAGMTIMVVDGTLSGVSLPLRPGDVIELEGFLSIFGSGAPERAWQLTPLDGESIDVLDEIDPNLPWLQPVTVTTADINKAVTEVGGETVVRANWDNWNSLNSQYVRIEEAVITNSQEDPPTWGFASFGMDERVVHRTFALSLRYRNDRHGSYPPPPAFFTRPPDDPFIAPPIGALSNVQGFLSFGTFDTFNIGQPQGAVFYINPIRDEDLELTTSPPVIAVDPLDAVPTGPFQVFATVVSGSGDPLTQIDLHYEYSSGASGVIGMQPAAGENRFVATIPATASENGAFVSYYVRAVDSGGLENSSTPRHTRVLFGGITQIEHIQRTWNDGAGPSPFAGISTDMQLNAVVMTPPGESGIISIQDDPDLGPWTGVFIVPSEALLATLAIGDRVSITHAEIQESFALTRLLVATDDIQVTQPGDPFGYVTGLPTGLFAQDADFSESYEGMALRFDDVIITQADAGFGEWRFSSGGNPNNAILGDDESDLIPGGNSMFGNGDHVEFIQGIWSFTFSEYKLWPQTLDDIGQITVDSESEGTAHAISLDGAYPNPVASQATISYTLARSGQVRLDVFDVTGRRVAVLVDGEQTSGSQNVTLDARALASGVYLVRLAADGEVRTTRVVITR